MRWRVILAGGAVLLMLVLQFRQPGGAYACLCQSPAIEANFDAADVVFQGEVVAIEQLNEYEANVTFDVSIAWKGDLRTLVVRTSGPGSCTDYPFAMGNEWIVFAGAGRASADVLKPLPCGFTGPASSRMRAALTLIQSEPQTLTGMPPPGAFPWGWLALAAGLGAAGIWRWRRLTRPI